MIEVPAAAIMADGLAEVADFFSIGTNDLVQYTLAADRTNPALAELAIAAPAGRAAAHRLGSSGAAARHGRHVAVCGEAAADPAVIPLLVGLGVDELSVSAELGRPRRVRRLRSPRLDLGARALATRDRRRRSATLAGRGRARARCDRH